MFEVRIRKLRERLTKEKVNAVLISAVSNITYLSGYANFSKDEREAYIFIGKDFGYIITDGRYSEAIQKQVPHLKLFERSHKKTIASFFKKHKSRIKKLGVEEDNLTVAEHKTLSKHFKKIKPFDTSHLRSIKTKEEIKKIEKACEIGDLAFKFILKKIKTGVTEKEITHQLENFIRGKSAEISFPPIVAFGKNSAMPHHQTGNTQLTKEDGFVLLDFGVKLNDYCSDMTRTIFFGKLTNKQKKIYEIVLKAQQKAVDFLNSAIKTGRMIRAAEVDKVARDYIISKGFPTIPHSVGHGVGLEVHEHPSLSSLSKDILKEGMVFSIEPGIYLEGFGGVRIEDLFVLEKTSLRQITTSSKKLIVIH